MRLFLFILWILPAISAATPAQPSAAPTPASLVDILSAQAQYSYFLRQLQRNGLIPILNRLSNVTLLAPINLAFSSDADGDFDNNQLLRYIVDQRFRVGYLDDNEVLFNTLYRNHDDSQYPISIRPDFDTAEYVIDGVSAIVDPDVYAKHQHSFIQGIENILPLKPSLCDVLVGDHVVPSHNIGFIQTLFKSLFTDEVSIDRKKKHKKKHKTPKPTFPKTCPEFFKNTNTVFVPTDDYVLDSLLEIDLKYYTTLFRTWNSSTLYGTTDEALLEVKTDVYNLLHQLMVPELVGGTNGTNATRLSNGLKARLNETSHKIVLNDKISSSHSQAFSNGVLHIFGPQNNTKFFTDLNITTIDTIPRKSLIAHHYSNFVEELEFRSLEYLIDGSTKNQTIFVDQNQRDDMFDEISTSSFSSKQSLLYQFAEGNIDMALVQQNKVYYELLESKLCSKKRIAGCFKLKLGVSTEPLAVITINDDVELISPRIDGGNDTFIYVTDTEITPPLNFKRSLGALMSEGSVPRHTQHLGIDQKSCLTTIGYLGQFDLLNLDDNNRGYSVFLPCGVPDENDIAYKKSAFKGAWHELGLVLKYLETNPNLFEGILKGMFLEDTVYSDITKTRYVKTLRGDKVKVSNDFIDGAQNNYININHTEVSIPKNSDILFSHGVVHIINQVLLPENFEIPFYDLLETTLDNSYPAHSIIDLVKLYPKLTQALTRKDEPYSLLVPSAESLKDFNITADYREIFRFLEFHLIPNDQVGKLLECMEGPYSNKTYNDNSVIKTNLTDTGFTCSRRSNGKVFLRMYDSRAAEEDSVVGTMGYNKNKEVRVVSHGCTSFNRTLGSADGVSCVFLLEKPLNLKWLEAPKNDFLHIHLGFVSIGVGIIIGLIVFGGILLTAVLCLGQTNTKVRQTKQFVPFSFPTSEEPSFMPVLTDEDDPTLFDRGYETDVDVLRDTDPLIPTHGRRKKRSARRAIGYGSIPPKPERTVITGAVSAPRTIVGNTQRGLQRDRNIPY